MFDRLPTPYGLVRGGVAPDHPKIKSVTKVYEKIAAHPHFRFFGNVEFGKHMCLSDLKEYYHQILYATGAQTDRHMGIPGEDLIGSFPATAFVGWYNGHPDYSHLHFDLSQESVAVIGVGNVALDVARILMRTPEELAKTEIADYALEALSASRVKQVHLLGRRGPAQAAFTNPELKEVCELAGTDVCTLLEDMQVDSLTQAIIENHPDPLLKKKIDLLNSYAPCGPTDKSRRLLIRFMVSPIGLLSETNGHVEKLRLARNVLAQNANGQIIAKATNEIHELQVGLVFRSVGYRGVPLPDVPFDHQASVIVNAKGRVLDPATHQTRVGEYTSGWIKRGSNGVIGTNKPDSVETVECMVQDAQTGATLQPTYPDPVSAERLVRERQPRFFTFADWLKLDQLEIARGAANGRLRIKFTSVADMLAALEK